MSRLLDNYITRRTGMPCNIGYKSYATIKIPAPEPQTFTNNAMAPDIDADLLEKLGQEDTQFLEWAQELLNYTVRITHKGGEFILEAEEEDKTHPCDYIKVSKKGGDATIVFEHFKSRDALKLETAKVLVLAHKLGIKIALGKSEVTEGDPLPNENRLRHRHDHGHSPDHSH